MHLYNAEIDRVANEIVEFAPGDPIRLYARSGRLTPDVVDQLRAVFGLDKPLWQQFLIYLNGLVHGDLGFSYTYRQPVAQIVGARLVNTFVLLTAATIIVAALGIVLGVWAASRRGSKADSSIVISSLVTWSMPTFWTGMLLLFAFGVWFHVLPTTGISTCRRRVSTPSLCWARRPSPTWTSRAAASRPSPTSARTGASS